MTQSGGRINDNFMAMVSAKADVYPAFERISAAIYSSCARNITCSRARFPAIDYHNHLDALDPVEVLRVMDACGIERMVNITMKTGDEAIQMIHKWSSVDAGRFTTIGWMDWSDVAADNFVAVTLDRLEKLVEHGARGIKFWKDLGLTVRDGKGDLLRVDGRGAWRLSSDKAAELGIPVMFHICRSRCILLADGRAKRTL